MATATVARTANALRTRRDAPRPSLPPKRTSGIMLADGGGGSVEPTARKKQKLSEPFVVTREHILSKFKGNRPSLTLHLHPTFFRFDGIEGSFPYESAMKFFLNHLRNQTVPHEMLEELLSNNVPFYDGCLIVEIHNHRTANGKDKTRHDSAGADGDQVKYSMHNYNSYVTPSPLVPYPNKAKESEGLDQVDTAEEAAQSKASNDKTKSQDGPHITTMVMFPTDLSLHHEMLILARTPASEMRGKKRSTDGSTPSAGQPPTPQLLPTSLAQSSRPTGQDQKMCLEEQDFYQFQAEVLLATQPPLLLDAVKTPQEAQHVLDLLAHPRHSNLPPSPKTRKRTTAEMAADDALAQESERRMLIMDERIKQSAPGTSDTAGNAQAMGFSRFKTIQMVREKHEEQERQKKEEEAQAALQRRQQEEADRAEAQRKQAQAEHARKVMAQRQNLARQQQEHMRSQQMAAQQAMMAQNHAHPQQNNMMMNQQSGNFQHPASMPQASPVVRQQTPMMNSSPMLQQGGFPMTATSSQGAGSPTRPTSAAMTNPAMPMVRQASQQQPQGSRNGTPQMPQGTPSMSGAMPSRQMNQTPRLPHGSPAPGTPSANIPNMPLQTQQQFTPEQIALLQARQAQLQGQRGMAAGSPGQQNPGQNNMTPEQIQSIRQHQLLMAQAVQQGATPQQAQAMLLQRRNLMMQQQRSMQQQQQQRILMQQQQQNANGGHAGSPQSGMQVTPQMGHAHPQQGNEMQQGQQMTPQQRQHQQAQLREAQAQLQQVAGQYGGFANIPPQAIQSLPPAAQQMLRSQQQRQQTVRAQAMALRAQQAQNAGQAVAGSSTADPEYMQTLRQHQLMLAQANQSGQGGMGGMGMTHNMNFGNMQNQQFGGQGGGGAGNDLTPQFQAMQNALNRGSSGMGQ